MTATPAKPTIIDRLRADGRLPDALEEALGTKIDRDKTTAARCLNHPAHQNGDAHPSMIVEPRAGRAVCPVCGLSEGLLDLVVRAGHGANRAEAATWLERRWYGEPKKRDDAAAPAPSATNPSAPPTAKKPRKSWDLAGWWKEARANLETMRSDAAVGPALDTFGREALDELQVGYLPASPKYVASLVFPVEDGTGRIVGLKLRALTKPKDGVKSRSLGAAGEGLIGRRGLLAKKDARPLVTGGEKDCLAGLKAAPEFAWCTVASGEGSSLAGSVIDLFEGRDVVVLYDKDEAGQKGAEKVARQLAFRAASVALGTIPDEILDGSKEEKDVADLCRKLGPAAGEALRKIVEEAKPYVAPAKRPQVVVRQRLSEVTDEAEAALVARKSADLYSRAGLLVRIVRADGRRKRSKKKGAVNRPAGAPVIEVASAAYVRECLDRSAEFVKIEQTQDGPVVKAALPPQWITDTLMARGSWPLPGLEGIVETPTLRADGSILDRPGYDVETGLLYEPSARFLQVPESPMAEDVRAAVATLLDPFTDFPFVASCDRAAAASGYMTTIARYAIDGPAPMVVVRAPTPGTGKTKVVDILSIVATGRPAARMTMGKDDAETRKLILSIGLEGGSIVLLDNIEGAFGSPALAAALTSTVFRDRLLGASKLVTVSLAGTSWFATGNGVSFKGDLGRRVLPVDLDAGVEHPEDRGGFRHQNVLAFVAERRPQIVAAALTVLRAYHVAGRPSHGLPRVGSFEEWDDLVRGASIWAGIGDPVEGRERVREESDADLDSLREALAIWHEVFGVFAVTVATVVEKAGVHAELRAALATLIGCPAEKVNARLLGYALRRVRGRLAGGRRFERAGLTDGKARWRLADAPDARRQAGDGDGDDRADDDHDCGDTSAENVVAEEAGSCCAA